MFSGRGAFVARLSASQAEEIYLMRIALEPILLERAIPLTAETDWLRAGGILAALQANELPFHQWHALDYELHMILYSQAQLPTMKKLVANLHSNLARYYRIFDALGADFRTEGNAEHLTILEACKAKDVKMATNTLKEHLTRSSKRLLKALMSYTESDKP